MRLQRNNHMKNLIQAAVVTLLAASAAHAQQAVQWKVSDGGNGHWYGMRPIDYSRSWSDFIGTCAQIGATPAVLNSSSDADWISSHVVTNPPGDGALLGAELIPTSAGGVEWRWIDGSSLSSSVPWCGGAPTGPAELERWLYMNDQAHAHPTAPAGCLDDCPWGGWSSINVPWAVIEWSADCNNDGIIDYGQCHDGTLPDYNGNNVPDCCERGEACVVGNYPVQWRVEDGGNGHWYQGIVPTPLVSWFEAKFKCESLGGHLVTFTSATEHQFVYQRIAQSPQIWHLHQTCGCTRIGPWIGMRRTTDWQWVTGEPVSFTSWHPSEPWEGSPHDFVRFFHYSGPLSPAPLWDNYLNGDDSQDISTPTSLIIEWSADCNGDGIVDYGQILQGQLADLNADGVPDICQQPTCRDADLYRNNRIDGADLGILLSEWGPVTPLTNSDINKDGFVNGADLGIMLSFWGACPN